MIADVPDDLLDDRELRHALAAAEIEARPDGGPDPAALRVEPCATAPASPSAWLVVLRRSEPREVVLRAAGADGGLGDLPAGATVALTGERRAALLGLHRPALQAVRVDDLRGAAALLERGEVDAAIASDDEARVLGLTDRIVEALEPVSWLPAPGQGGLVIVPAGGGLGTSRTGALPDPVRLALGRIEHGPTRVEVSTELAVRDALDARLGSRLGVLARVHGRRIRVRAMVVDAARPRMVRAEASADVTEAAETARRVADDLVRRGASELAA